MPQGIVLRRQADFYYVQSESHIYECKLRGRLKKTGPEVLVGDRVEFSTVSPETGVIEVVSPRLSVLFRPPVANVDQILAIFAVKEPEPIWQLLDRILVNAEAVGLAALICFNKIDLGAGDEVSEAGKAYEKAGYRVFFVSVRDGVGLSHVQEALRDKITCLAGPSGVGKSSLINALGGFGVEIGSISRKLGRGRHTTRHVELFSLGGGLVADTPGFSRLSLDITAEELSDLFPEFQEVGPCRFSSCLHRKEPDCAVKDALERGEISRTRYESYLALLEEVESEKRY